MIIAFIMGIISVVGLERWKNISIKIYRIGRKLMGNDQSIDRGLGSGDAMGEVGEQNFDNEQQ